jgi:hypothetical protein
MLATIASLVLGVTGAGLGYAGWHTATRSAARQREQIALIASEVVRHSIQVATETSIRNEEGLMNLSAQLENLEITAFEQLITRGEVSAAFAELAAIEEQRQRQSAAVRATAAPAPSNGSLTQAPAVVDPWPATASEPAPTDQAVLISEITAMNERLREKLRGAGVIGQRPA